MITGRLGLSGMGGLTDKICADANAIVNDPSISMFSMIKSVALFNKALCAGSVGLYDLVRYGDVPAPGSGLPDAPAPAAPRTRAEIDNWNPDSLSIRDAEQYQAWKDETRDAIILAEQTGTYMPEGGLPFSAEFLETYKWWMLGGIAALALLVYTKRPRL